MLPMKLITKNSIINSDNILRRIRFPNKPNILSNPSLSIQSRHNNKKTNLRYFQNLIQHNPKNAIWFLWNSLTKVLPRYLHLSPIRPPRVPRSICINFSWKHRTHRVFIHEWLASKWKSSPKFILNAARRNSFRGL